MIEVNCNIFSVICNMFDLLWVLKGKICNISVHKYNMNGAKGETLAEFFRIIPLGGIRMSKKMELRNAVGYRLKQVRQSLSYTQDRMAAYFGTSRTSYTKYEIGDIFPNHLIMHKLASDFDVSLDWLICAKGPMFFEQKQAQPEEGLQSPAQEPPQERKEPLSQDQQQLLTHMEKIPLLNHEIMVYFHRFLLENKELVESAMHPEEEDSPQ